MKEAECSQLNCHDARFGSAVSAIGDVDLDGYQGRLMQSSLQNFYYDICRYHSVFNSAAH